ncbi:MAG: RNA polymerase sigma factor [Chloroflexota bacterium]
MESSDKTDDIEILKRIENGDNDAVTELYNTHVDRIYSLILNQVDSDREMAQEILQETFIAAVRSAGKFRGKSKVYTWLCSIASRKVADYYRYKKRETKHRVQYSVDSDEIQDTSDNIITILESEETNKGVRKTLFSLPIHYRQVLLLKYVEKLPVSEISEIMERSPKSIEGLLTRARKEFQAKLTG